MSKRYFTEDANDESIEVFAIGKKETNHAIKDRNIVTKEKRKEFKRVKETLYAKKRKKDRDKFPGRAPVQPEVLEKHQYSEAVDVKRIKSKFAQKLAVKKEKDRKRAHEIAARTEILLQDEAGFLEPDSDDEFTGTGNELKS